MYTCSGTRVRSCGVVSCGNMAIISMRCSRFVALLNLHMHVLCLVSKPGYVLASLNIGAIGRPMICDI